MFSEIVKLVSSLAWPVTVFIIILLFRREIRESLRWIKEVRFPGGSVTLERDVKNLEAKVEASKSNAELSQYIPPLPHDEPMLISDPLLSIAQFRIDIEREIFRLSQVSFTNTTPDPWDVTKCVQNLSNTDMLDAELAQQLISFLQLSEKAIHSPSTPEDLKVRLVSLGATIVTTLRRKRKIKEARRDFEGHGLWHIGRKGGREENRYYWWSAVAASIPLFDYSYDIYKEALEEYNEKSRKKHELGEAFPDTIPVLSLKEFISLLKFRERELLRLLEIKGSWSEFEKENEWKWPSEWGNVGWRGPIIHDSLSQNKVEQDLIRTRSALNSLRGRLF